ncbi:MAG TPA: hypothetical protein PK610_10740, partial [Flavobacteriales bacterium]|nr:hypothetical protein [Flavobacteriales bacterium]
FTLFICCQCKFFLSGAKSSATLSPTCTKALRKGVPLFFVLNIGNVVKFEISINSNQNKETLR